MQTLVIDTNGIVKSWNSAAFRVRNPKGITDALKDLDTSALATKADLKDALSNIETRLYKFLAGVLIAHGLGTAALTVALLQLLSEPTNDALLVDTAPEPGTRDTSTDEGGIRFGDQGSPIFLSSSSTRDCSAFVATSCMNPWGKSLRLATIC
jgi:hypothetical protein